MISAVYSAAAASILQLLREEFMIRFSKTPELFAILQPEPQAGLTAALGTDGTFLYYDAAQVCALFQNSSDVLEAMYLHVHLHCMLHHPFRPLFFPDMQDFALQESLCPDLDYQTRCDREVSLLLQELLPHSSVPGLSSLCRDSHQFWPALKKPSSSVLFPELPPDAAALGTLPASSCEARQAQNLCSLWKTPVCALKDAVSRKSGARRGRSPGGQSENARLQEQDSYDYHQFLRRFAVPREEPMLDPDSFDFIYYCYGLEHYGNLPLAEPLEYKEVFRLDEIAIAIDTSGSCSGRIVRRFLEETWNILKQRDNFFPKMRLHLIQCDSMVQDYRVFTSVREWEESLEQFKIQGQGSTDFRPVFALLDEQIARKEIQNLRGLLYFTDGDGIYPRQAPDYDTAFVFLNRALEKQKIPSWAIRLNLHLPEENL